jgi:uncharacterized RDD family membrane protein YckC
MPARHASSPSRDRGAIWSTLRYGEVVDTSPEPPSGGTPPPPPAQPDPGYAIRPYPQPAYPELPAYGYAPALDRRPGPSATLIYAGFWIRAGALFVDWVILSAVLFTLGHFASIGYHIDSTVTTINGVNQGTTAMRIDGPWPLLISGLYYVLLWWTYDATVGQLLLRLRVVRVLDGSRPDFGRLVLRYVGYVIAAIPLGIGLIWAAFDPGKQGWHDKIADTLVVAPR